MRHPLLRLSLLLAALASSCATPPSAPATLADAPPGDRTFLWEVRSAQMHSGLVYLMGSIHLARPGELSLPPAMVKAFVLSDALVVEVDAGAMDPSKVRQFIQEHGLLPEGQRLSQQLEPETAKLLAAAAERAGTSTEGLEHMRPWLVAMSLSSLVPRRASSAPGLGMDMLLLAQARGTKPIIELETAEEQLRVFSDLPEAVQERMLRNQLLHLEDREAALERLTEAWNAGDTEALAAEVFRQEREDPELRPMYEKLFYERNARMAEKIGELLAQPRVSLVVVGAGHVVGPRGLVALLRKQGHQVRQLPKGEQGH